MPRAVDESFGRVLESTRRLAWIRPWLKSRKPIPAPSVPQNARLSGQSSITATPCDKPGSSGVGQSLDQDSPTRFGTQAPSAIAPRLCQSRMDSRPAADEPAS